jgi:hypothetical protein
MAATFTFALLLYHMTERLDDIRYGVNPWRSEPLDKFFLRL